MKKIEAIIRLSKFEDVTEALGLIGVNFFTYAKVSGHGREKGDTVTYRGAVYDSGDIPRILMEIVVPDEKLDETITTISQTAQTNVIGDGVIIVTDVIDFIRIRTGKRGTPALNGNK